jgi:hypothetical protein
MENHPCPKDGVIGECKVSRQDNIALRLSTVISERTCLISRNWDTANRLAAKAHSRHIDRPDELTSRRYKNATFKISVYLFTAPLAFHSYHENLSALACVPLTAPFLAVPFP